MKPQQRSLMSRTKGGSGISRSTDLVSVGVVAESEISTGRHETPTRSSPAKSAIVWIYDHVKDADGSSRARHRRVLLLLETDRRRWLCLVGDAFAFLDPLFSSGVFLALKSGEMAADAIHGGLEANDLSAARFDTYLNSQRHAVAGFRALVCAFYDLTFSSGVPRRIPAPAQLHCRYACRQRVQRPDAALPGARRVRRARHSRRNHHDDRVAWPNASRISLSTTRSFTRPTSRASCTSAGISSTWRKPNTRSGAAWDEHRSSQTRIRFPRVNATCDFKAPLKFEDEFEVHAVVDTIGRRSIRYAFTLRARQRSDGDGDHDIRVRQA